MPFGRFRSDIVGTEHVLQVAAANGVRKFLFTSSGAVYGRQPADLERILEDSTDAPSTMDPGADYGQAKRASEFMTMMYARAFEFDALIARLFAFVGPSLPLDADFAVGNFLRDFRNGGPIRISGDGSPYRSYLYAADLTVWLWTILLRGRADRPYNVGSAEAISIHDLATLVAGLASPALRIEQARQPVAGAERPRYVPDVRRAEEELGLRAWIPVEEGLRRTSEWLRGKSPSSAPHSLRVRPDLI